MIKNKLSLLPLKRLINLSIVSMGLLCLINKPVYANKVEPNIKEVNKRFSVFINPKLQVSAKQVQTKPVSAKAVTASQAIANQARTFVPDSIKIANLTIQGQYQFLLSRTRTLNGYKMVNPYRLAGFYQNAQDSINKGKLQIKEQSTLVKTLQDSLNQTKIQLAEKSDALNNTQQSEDQINFLGINFNKTSYHLLVWSIIIGLALALFIIIARSTQKIMEAKNRAMAYDEISSEFQAYKSKANEKERKLARELQDERNLVEELKSRGH